MCVCVCVCVCVCEVIGFEKLTCWTTTLLAKFQLRTPDSNSELVGYFAGCFVSLRIHPSGSVKAK